MLKLKTTQSILHLSVTVRRERCLVVSYFNDERLALSKANTRDKLNIAGKLSSIISDLKNRSSNDENDITKRLEFVLHDLVPASKTSNSILTNNHHLELGFTETNCRDVNKTSTSKLVCDELYTSEWHWSYIAQWYRDTSSECLSKLPGLLTIVLNSRNADDKRITSEVKKFYPGVRILTGTSWPVLLSNVNTPFVLIGRDLDNFCDWSNIERSIRLLEVYGRSVAAVGGSIRNSTGHWRTGCFQTTIRYYNLNLQEGYARSICDDCMICPYLEGPFVTKTKLIRDKLLDFGRSEDLSFLNWFLDMSMKNGYEPLVCPDIMYSTKGSGHIEAEVDDWRRMAKVQQFQGLVMDHSPRLKFNFDCSEIGLKCQPRSDADSFLLPLCCTRNYLYILESLEEISEKLSVEYELDTGSLLGAVKLSNFIPWDIDGDVFIKTEHLNEFFYPWSGLGRKFMTEKGIELSMMWPDNYADKGAEYFKLCFGGIEIEMMGRRNLSTRELRETFGGRRKLYPTKVKVGNKVWSKSIPNPGKYLRSRYGPGYLRHAQSWRYQEGQGDSYEFQKNSGKWRVCRKPRHHSCLDLYPGDGNLDLLPSVYPDNL